MKFFDQDVLQGYDLNKIIRDNFFWEINQTLFIRTIKTLLLFGKLLKNFYKLSEKYT